METKECGTCHEVKPIEKFSRKRGKWSSKCKDCHNKYYREYWKNTDAYEKHKSRVAESRRANPYREQARKYGTTVEKVEEILTANDGLCLICNEREAVCIDHCHKTLEVRGGLCSLCNAGIGMLGDSPERLLAAARYLGGSIPSVL